MKTRIRLSVTSPVRAQQLFIVLIACIALSIPFQAIYNSLLVIALMVVWLFFLPKQIHQTGLAVMAIISVPFWLSLIGLTYSENINEGLFRVQQKSLFVIFPIILGSVDIDWDRALRWAFSAFVVGIVGACVVSVAMTLTYGPREDFFLVSVLPSGRLMNLYPYILALMCLIGIVILSETFVRHRLLSQWLMGNIFRWIAIAFLIIVVLLLGVKQTIFALTLIAFFYSFRFKKQLTLIIWLVAILLVAIAFAFLPGVKGRVQEALAEVSNENPLKVQPESAMPLNGIALRRAIWVCAVDVIRNHPVLGVGTGDGQDELQKAYAQRQFILAADYNRFNAHNQYLQMLVVAGVVGFVFWLGSIAWLLVQFRESMLLKLIMSISLFCMLTESMLETNKGCLVMSFFVSSICFAARAKNLKKP